LFSEKPQTALNILPFENERQKNHPGGLRDIEDNSQTIMCEWPDNPVRCIKKYLQERNPNCPALWPKPRNYSPGKFNERDAVWYYNVPLGKITSDNLLGSMSKKTELSNDSLHIALYSHDISNQPQSNQPGEFES